MRLVDLTTPGSYPVTVAEARRQCALYDDTTHDELLLSYIVSVTREVEDYTKSKIMQRSVCLYLDKFPAGDVDLKTYPISSITSVKYDDSSDTEQTLATSNYWSSLHGMQPFLRPVNTWPVTYSDKPNAVRITFVAGYSSVDVVPMDLKQAMLQRIYEMFEQREPGTSLNKLLAMPHKRFNV